MTKLSKEEARAIAAAEVQKVRRDTWKGGASGFVIGTLVGTCGHYVAQHYVPWFTKRLNRKTMVFAVAGSATFGAFIGALLGGEYSARRVSETYQEG
jgi:uncharacterized membrane protein